MRFDRAIRYDDARNMFNAVSIEHTLSRFFGDEIGTRDSFYDADLFREGDPKELAEMMRHVAAHFEKRAARIQYPAQLDGTTKAYIASCASQLRSLADQVRQRKKNESEDYHWEVFGALMRGIVGLLETLEAVSAPHERPIIH